MYHVAGNNLPSFSLLREHLAKTTGVGPAPATVGAAPTFSEFLGIFKSPWFWIPVGLLAVGLIWIKIIDPILLRNRVLRQRDAIIKMGYANMGTKKMKPGEAQKWANEMFISMGDFAEDPLFDPESIKPGKTAFSKDNKKKKRKKSSKKKSRKKRG